MAKPALMIDILGKGPGDESDEDEESGADPEEDRAPPRDPEVVFTEIERALAELRRSYDEAG
jgi:hypothetical protein